MSISPGLGLGLGCGPALSSQLYDEQLDCKELTILEGL